MVRNYTKELQSLLRNIGKLSGGQALICDWDSDDCSTFVLEIAPSGGLYAGGKFKFTFELCTDSYPAVSPKIVCTTPIYHPNIDTIGENFEETNICVSLLDEWTEDNGLDDCVQALLFLFYNPNNEDPLCPLICPDITDEEFKDNVKISLEGGDVEGQIYETNYGYQETNKVKDDVNSEEQLQTDDEKVVETSDEAKSEEFIVKLDKSVGGVNSNKDNQENNCGTSETYQESATDSVKTEKTSDENTKTDSEILTTMNLDPKDMQEKDTQIQRYKSDQNDIKTSASIGLQSCDQVDIFYAKYPRYSNNFTELYHAFDNLVPYNTLISVMCTHFIRRVYKWR